MDAAFWITTAVQASVLMVLILILHVLHDLCYALSSLVAAVMMEHRDRAEARERNARDTDHD